MCVFEVTVSPSALRFRATYKKQKHHTEMWLRRIAIVSCPSAIPWPPTPTGHLTQGRSQESSAEQVGAWL